VAEVNRSLKLGVNLFTSFTISFRTDVFRFLFDGKGRESPFRNGLFYDSDAFDATYFPVEWNVAHDRLGDGCKVLFPIRMHSKLKWATTVYKKEADDVVPKSKSFTEVCTIWLVKQRC